MPLLPLIIASLLGAPASAGPGMEITFGNDATPATAGRFRDLGATSVESYVTWQTVEGAGQGQWDWSHWDQQVEVLEQAGLKWVPFLIAGPAYATPKWFRESSQSVPYVCLEHRQPSKVQSIWNPHLKPQIDRFLKAFADRYRDRGVAESLLLGVTGIYGESIYPAGPEGGWTAKIPGFYHNHAGWWAGDQYAAADFRRYLGERYKDIGSLNRAWNSRYASFEAVAPFLPDKAPSLRARADLVDWYTRAMTDWATFWVSATRRHFPKTEIYLCTGGDGNPALGADFSAQAKAIAPFGAGIRITNEGSSYTHNFCITREVATACAAFGTYFGYEPAAGVDPNGVIARIYNATASGARQLHSYANNVTASDEATANFRRYAPFLQRRSPRLFAGVYLPKTSWALEPDCIRRLYNLAAELRDRADVAFVDRTTLSASSLADLRVLVAAHAPYIEAEEAAALRQWIQRGGILLTLADPKEPLFRTPEGSDAARAELLVSPSQDGSEKTGTGSEQTRRSARSTASSEVPVPVFSVVLDGKPPRRFRLEMGSDRDADCLDGDWHGPERAGMWPDGRGAHMRWTGARAGFHLAIDPATDAHLTLEVHVPSHALAGPNRVLVNGSPVGTLDRAGTRTYRFPVPRAVLAGKPVAELTLEVHAWRPADHGQGDTRWLGVAVRSVEICSQGAESEPSAPVALRAAIDWDAVQSQCVRRIGKGATVTLPARDRAGTVLGEALVQMLTHPERLLPGTKGIHLPGSDADGVYATQFPEGVLLHNGTDRPRTVAGIEVPAHGIAWGNASGM